MVEGKEIKTRRRGNKKQHKSRKLYRTVSVTRVIQKFYILLYSDSKYKKAHKQKKFLL